MITELKMPVLFAVLATLGIQSLPEISLSEESKTTLLWVKNNLVPEREH